MAVTANNTDTRHVFRLTREQLEYVIQHPPRIRRGWFNGQSDFPADTLHLLEAIRDHPDFHSASEWYYPSMYHGDPSKRISLHDHIHEHLQAITPSALLQSSIVVDEASMNHPRIIQAIAVPWDRILRELEQDPDFLFTYVDQPRKFEEFIAEAYCRAGYNVELTPRSGDGGVDVVATKTGFGSVRILDQCKAYKPGHVVTADNLRAMLGVLSRDRNASKGVVITTSTFAPRILRGREFTPFIPHRLELRDGKRLVA